MTKWQNDKMTKWAKETKKNNKTTKWHKQQNKETKLPLSGGALCEKNKTKPQNDNMTKRQSNHWEETLRAKETKKQQNNKMT